MAETVTRRERIGRYFLNLVRQKIAGIIPQAELDRLAAEPFDEQLALGIGASTEGAQLGARELIKK